MTTTTIHFDLETACLCIPYLQKLYMQAASIGLDRAYGSSAPIADGIGYKNKLSSTIVELMALLSDDTARLAVYYANIDEIHSLKEASFNSWVSSLKQAIQEPQELIDLRPPSE